MGDRGTQSYAYSGETTEWEVSPSVRPSVLSGSSRGSVCVCLEN